MAQKLCDNCGKRPAKMFTKRVFRGRRHLVVKSAKDHPLCNQCHSRNFESMLQEDLERKRQERK